MQRSLVMIMAGGKGSRLGPLTCHRAKPSTPFGGRYRIIDFVLSNFVNSGYRQICVLTQYMAGSLIRHLSRTWHLAGYDEFIEITPAQMRSGDHWYRGTADSIFQNMNLIRDYQPKHVAIFGGDHIYKCAVDQMEAYHRDLDADLTIAAYPVPRQEAHEFGVIQVDTEGRIVGFQEKPDTPIPIPGQPDTCLVSMGNYFFKTKVLVRVLQENVVRDDTGHDFGKDIIPTLLGEGASIYAYDFRENEVPGDPEGVRPYWRDVGNIDSYFKASMELRGPVPSLNLYNRRWRIRTAQRNHPPARFVPSDAHPTRLDDCMVCEGSVVEGGALRESLIGYDCFVRAGAEVDGSMFMSGCEIGEGAKLRGVLADKNCVIEPGAHIGHDPTLDQYRFPFITPNGIIVLPKGTRVPVEGPIEFAQDIGELLVTDAATKDAVARTQIYPIMGDHHRHSYRSAGPGSTRSS